MNLQKLLNAMQHHKWVTRSLKHLAQLKLRIFIITADDIDFGNHIFNRITSVTSKEGSALEIDAEGCLSEYCWFQMWWDGI